MVSQRRIGGESAPWECGLALQPQILILSPLGGLLCCQVEVDCRRQLLFFLLVSHSLPSANGFPARILAPDILQWLSVRGVCRLSTIVSAGANCRQKRQGRNWRCIVKHMKITSEKREEGKATKDDQKRTKTLVLHDASAGTGRRKKQRKRRGRQKTGQGRRERGDFTRKQTRHRQ